MIHLGASPGTPKASGAPADVAGAAAREASLLREAGVDGLLLENMHDVPYLRREVGPEVTAQMTAAALAVRPVAHDLPIGVQVLAGASRPAMAVAHAAGLDFIRAEAFVFGHLADEGWMDADAGELLRYRKAIGSESIAVFTDIKKKHAAHALTADVDLQETARAAAFFLADGVIVTGAATGRQAAPDDVAAVRDAVDLPVLVGSGITPDNAASYASADAFIVGSSLKVDGSWANAIDPARVTAMVDAVGRLRG